MLIDIRHSKKKIISIGAAAHTPQLIAESNGGVVETLIHLPKAAFINIMFQRMRTKKKLNKKNTRNFKSAIAVKSMAMLLSYVILIQIIGHLILFHSRNIG